MRNIISPFKNLINYKYNSPDTVIFSLFLILIPIVLITGPALPDILLSSIALYFLIKSIWKKYWHYYQNPIVYGFLIFSVYGILRSLFSEIPFESLTNEGSIFYFRYIFFAMGVWHLLDINPHLSKCLLIISLICLLVVCIDGMYQYFNEVNLFGNKKIYDERLTGLFGKEPIIGRYIAYLSIFTFALIYQNFKTSKRVIIISISFLIMCEVIVFLTGERAPLFYITLFSILIIIYIPKFRIYRIIGALISICIIVAIIQINPDSKSRMVDYTIEEITQTKVPYLPYGPVHEEHYVSAFKMFLDKPIFGVGTNSFRIQCNKSKYHYKERSCSSHPHQYFIQILAEQGIVGFLFLLSFFIYIVSIGLKQLYHMVFSNKNKILPFELFLFAMILFVYWWPLIPHMSFYNNWNNVLMMLPLGFFMKSFFGKL